MTEQEILALGDKEKTPVTPAATEEAASANGATANGKNGAQPYPDDWPEPAIKRINQMHGQKIGLNAKLEQERAQRLAVEARLRDQEARNKRLEAEMPVYQKMALDQSKARYELENTRAAEGLANVFRTGELTPEALGTTVGNIVSSKLSQIELKRAEDELAAPRQAETPAPPIDTWDQLERDGKTAVKRNVYNSDAAQFMAKHGFDLSSDESTTAGKKKNAALLLDKSAVQRGHLVGSLAYWEFIDDGLRRAVPEERSGSGTDHTQTEPTPQSPRAIPSVAAPAARTSTAVNGGPRQKIELSAFDRDFLKRHPKLTEADIIREIEHERSWQ